MPDKTIDYKGDGQTSLDTPSERPVDLPSMDLRNSKILVVEDSRLDQHIIHDAIENTATLTFTRTAEDALDHCSAVEFDLILLDVMIPEMGGVELCRKLKSNTRTQNIPIMFITSLDEPDAEQKALALGAVDYITKPFAPEVVRVRVENQVALVRATRELRKTNEKLRLLSVTDPLTGVFNRRQFEDLTKGWLDRPESHEANCCILALDLDKFKAVNDQRGHAAGDAVLVAASKTWGDTIRPNDILGRIGGEEFAIFLPDTSLEEGRIAADRLCERTRDLRIADPKGAIHVTVSIGLATFENGHPPYAELMANADSALYVAKNNGRDRVEIH